MTNASEVPFEEAPRPTLLVVLRSAMFALMDRTPFRADYRVAGDSSNIRAIRTVLKYERDLEIAEG
jgi:hypothetical protein